MIVSSSLNGGNPRRNAVLCALFGSGQCMCVAKAAVLRSRFCCTCACTVRKMHSTKHTRAFMRVRARPNIPRWAPPVVTFLLQTNAKPIEPREEYVGEGTRCDLKGTRKNLTWKRTCLHVRTQQGSDAARRLVHQSIKITALAVVWNLFNNRFGCYFACNSRMVGC